MSFIAPVTSELLICILMCALLGGCQRPEPQNDGDSVREAGLEAEIERTFAPYRRVATEFLHATATGNYDRAYELLAPSYTNMVSKAVFSARIRENGNFTVQRKLEILKTISRAGTTTAQCRLGDLGLAEFVFLDRPDAPRLSAILVGGLSTLLSP